MPDAVVTQLLRDWEMGSEEARDRLFRILNDEIHALAAGQLRRERDDHTLQATALVNEAWIKLVDTPVSAETRAHFLAITARAIRQVLVDHARRRGRRKRGGGNAPLRLDEVGELVAGDAPEITDIDEAMERLARRDERKARVVELHYFGGLTYDEIAAAEGMSPATVKRDLRFARAWLKQELAGG